MFTTSAEYYDILYSWKDYGAEAATLRGIIEQYKRAPGAALLDVACGTGKHAQYFAENYTVEGLDLDGELLKVARARLPDVPFYQADMVDFDLGKQYDAITCLFSAIGYAKSEERLNSTLRTMARHLLPGGVLVVEPWLLPGQLIPRHVSARFVDEPELKIARINTMRVEDGISYLDFHYLIGTQDGVEHFTEEHALALFTDAQYRAAFTGVGLETHFDAPGLDGRGLYIGVKA